MQLRPTYLPRAAYAVTMIVAAVAVYVFSRTALPLQFAHYVGNHPTLSIAAGSLVLLVSFAIGSLVYGFTMEGRLGRSGKLHDLGR